MKFIIIHGTGGSPEGNWFFWLRDELEKKSHKVFVLKFPTPENQSLDNWMKVFQEYNLQIDEETVFIGHSLAPAFILSILERINVKVKGVILVSGFLNFLGNEFFDNLNKTFIDKKFNWEKIKRNCSNFYIINSNNDPYVPFEEGIKLAENLETKVIKIENAGHINSEFGFDKFEFILPFIEKLEK